MYRICCILNRNIQRSWNGRILVVVRLTDGPISQPLTASHTVPLSDLSDGHAEQNGYPLPA